jgi:hemerythrin-like domain-containing protein
VRNPNDPLPDTRDMPAAHTMFRREFALMPALVRGVKAGDKERAMVVADHIESLNTLLYHHDQGEGKHLWPKLLERAPVEAFPIVHVMERQHQSLEEIVIEVAEGIRMWRRSGAAPPAKALADALERLLSQADEHMRLEEERVLPIVEKYVTASEWDQMIQEAAAAAQAFPSAPRRIHGTATPPRSRM